MVLKIDLKPKKGSEKLAKKLPGELDVENDAVALTVFEYIAHNTHLSLNRIRLTVRSDKPVDGSRGKDRVIAQSDGLKAYSDGGRVEVYFRDLGPQVAWRTVFVLEYLGPLLIHPIFYYCRRQIYGSNEAPTLIQTIVYSCVMLHFLKRELETLFLHKFSLATMPLFNLFKNCSHYWLLSGVLVAYFGYAPASAWGSSASALSRLLFYSGGIVSRPEYLFVFVALWLYAEVSNFIVHVNLARLRPQGSTARAIPYGYGFRRVSCPNYFFESVGWFELTLLSANWAMALFYIVGSVQMYFWAKKKHQRYLKEFPDYPKDRKAMFPFIA